MTDPCLEWTECNSISLRKHWTARNNMADGWAASYDICIMENGEFRVWGLMCNHSHPGGEKYLDTLDEAKAIAQDDHERRQRVEAWREYTETHDPTGGEMIKAMKLLARERDTDEKGVIGVLRRDTLENWLAHDPVLADREVVWCFDVPWLKVGDGHSRFSELPWWMPETGEYRWAEDL